MSADLRKNCLLTPTACLALVIIVALVAKPFGEWPMQKSDATFHHVHHHNKSTQIKENHLKKSTDTTALPHAHNFKGGARPAEHAHCHSHSQMHGGAQPLFCSILDFLAVGNVMLGQDIQNYFEHDSILFQTSKNDVFRPPIFA